MEPVIQRAVSEFPVTLLTGPLQSGRATPLKRPFGKQYRYVPLDLPDVRMAAAIDPRRYIAMYPPPVILDEVQHVPELLPYIKERVDADRRKTGQYVIIGSQNLLFLERFTESLAGGAAALRLLPLTWRGFEGAIT